MLDVCPLESAPFDSKVARSLTQSETPDAPRRWLRVPGISGFFGLRTESGIPRQHGRQCGVEAQGGGGHEAGSSCVGALVPNRTCLWRVSVLSPHHRPWRTAAEL